MSQRPKVRVRFPDESSWAEHVEGDTYRSLNYALGVVPLKLPLGDPDAHMNGQEVSLCWGLSSKRRRSPRAW